MHKCRSYGPDKSGWMDAHMRIQLSKIVTAMSRFNASGLDKIHSSVHAKSFASIKLANNMIFARFVYLIKKKYKIIYGSGSKFGKK